MRGRGFGVMVVLFIGLLVAASASMSWAGSAQAPRISTDALKSQLGDPNLVIIDVRQVTDWKSSAKKIKGAVREDPADLESWEDDYPKDKMIVLYCA